jgi:soluble lytic murein transglycosylase
VKKWIAEHGDPRDARVDPIDWIEQIPFNETRNYVMRVLENTEVYRNRIAGRDEPLRILADLYKPNAPQTKPLDYTPPPPAPPAVAVPVPVPKPAAPNSAASL